MRESEISVVRTIHLEESLRIRFPGQDEKFAAGVEIGMLGAMMVQGLRDFARQIGADNVDQARALGQKLGYHLADIEDVAPDAVRVTFRNRAHGPKLTLVK